MKKAIILARVSTENQSLDSQIEKLIDEAKRYGYERDNITIISGKESGVKLDIEERQTIQQMKECIETGEYDMLFIWEVSRLARRPKVLYEVREYLINNRVNLRCLTPSFTMLKDDYTIDPTASIVFAIFGTMAEEEARLSKERMMRGRIAKRDKCKFIGGNILFGYDYDENDNIFINSEEAKTVNEMFKRYADNESIRSITKDLVDRGLLPYDNYDTAVVSMRKMIQRSEYAGITNGTYPYPAIIDQDLFYKAREIAESKNKYKIRESGCYWCQGILFNKDNNRLLSPAKCSVTYRTWDENSNSGFMVNLNIMDSLAWDVAKRQYIINPKITVDEELSNVKNKLYNLHDKIIFNRSKIKDLQKMNDRINDRIVRGKISESKGDKMIEENIAEIKNLGFRIRQWDSECVVYEQAIRAHNKNKGRVINIDNLNDDEKKLLIQQQIKRIEIQKISSSGRKITVYCYNGVEEHYEIKKRGNYTDIYKEGVLVEDFKLIIRFIRKGSKYSAGMTKRIYV